jgi:cobalt-zinc-cadmium efflux system outer membrane protein
MCTLNVRGTKRGWQYLAILSAVCASAQQSLTWEQIRERFLATNPTLQAARIGIEESHAQETTAYLRPNPDFTTGIDQIDPFSADPYRPFANIFPYATFDYLHERAHKRELRLESAKKGTVVAQSQLEDQQRNLLFNLRSAFVQTLQAKAVLALAKENLDYYDKTLQVSRDRKQAGDIAQVDLDRLELQRVQYESDLQTALVNLRTSPALERPVSRGELRRHGTLRVRREYRSAGRIAQDRYRSPAGFESGGAIGG